MKRSTLLYTKRKEITLVTVGRSGVGKSTLISNMLRWKGFSRKSQFTITIITLNIRLTTEYVGDVKVTIIDTPGLVTPDVGELKSIAALLQESGGKADMLLYCISQFKN